MKSELRKQFLAKRQSEQIVQEDIEAMAENLAEIFRRRGLQYIFSFMAYGGELDISLALQRRFPGMPFYYPRIESNFGMTFISEKGQGWSKNKYGIFEPKYLADCVRSADKTTMVVVPCLAADRLGFRLGYGGGYYDRYIVQNPAACYVTVLPDYALVERLPVGEFDQQVQIIVTPNKVMECD